MKSVLLIGAGSIGKQHLNNLIRLNQKDITVVSKHPQPIWKEVGIRHYYEINTALLQHDYEYAFICNPTTTHLQTLELLLNAGIKKIYLEKPVSNDDRQLEKLSLLIEQQHADVTIGFDLRFEPGIIKMKELIEQGKIGKVVSLTAEVGDYLPGWRPNIDFRNSVSASIEKGGGVLLELIHEFDYASYLLGEVQTVACLSQKSGILEIETEDIADVLLKFTSGATGNIHLDYLKPTFHRKCTLLGSNGMIQLDMVKKEVLMIDYQKISSVYSYSDYSRNDRLTDAISAFLDDRYDIPAATFEEGCYSLKMVLAAKKSSEEGVFVDLKNEVICSY